MAYNFKNLADVELLEEVPEGCTAFAEVDGVVKRVPSKGLGGEGGIKTAIIKRSDWDDEIGYATHPKSAPGYTYECLNMTFEEAYSAMESGEPVACFGMFGWFDGDPAQLYGVTIFKGITYGEPYIKMIFRGDSYEELYWTTDSLSTNSPASPQ
jgi:hypothetical protein